MSDFSSVGIVLQNAISKDYSFNDTWRRLATIGSAHRFTDAD